MKTWLGEYTTGEIDMIAIAVQRYANELLKIAEELRTASDEDRINMNLVRLCSVFVCSSCPAREICKEKAETEKELERERKELEELEDYDEYIDFLERFRGVWRHQVLVNGKWNTVNYTLHTWNGVHIDEREIKSWIKGCEISLKHTGKSLKAFERLSEILDSIR